MFVEFLLLLLGFVILIAGAEFLIKGSIAVAGRLGMTTLMIGLTVVAFGTSAPELFVSVEAAIGNSANVAIGNVVGSNICNILAIIGVAAVISAVAVPENILRRDVPIMLVAMIVLYILCFDGELSRLDGWLLFAGIVGYLYFSYLLVKRGGEDSVSLDVAEATIPRNQVPSGIAVIYIVAGLAAMVLGANFIVTSATTIAKALGVSDLVIGITLVALGTSLPELATTVLAALKGEGELAIGNAIGSNIFNVFCVLGVTAGISPLHVADDARVIDVPLSILACFIAWFFMRSRSTVGRFEGFFLLLFYAVYVAYLFMRQDSGT